MVLRIRLQSHQAQLTVLQYYTVHMHAMYSQTQNNTYTKMNLRTVKWAQWDNPIQRTVRSVQCSYVCAVHCVQLLHTILHRTDLIIFPLALQTITTASMMSIWGKDFLHSWQQFLLVYYTTFVAYESLYKCWCWMEEQHCFVDHSASLVFHCLTRWRLTFL